MVFITFIACVFIGIYTIFTLVFFKGWLAIPIFERDKNKISTTFITVIIPVRNEESNILNILKDIEIQDYNNKYFEVYFVNDCSTDNTEALINEFIATSKANINLLNLPKNILIQSPKKAAITTVVERAKGDLILTTDGDCRLPKTWLAMFAAIYESKNYKIISGPVTFLKNNSMFNSMQIVEFSSLIAVGGASIHLGMPNMCNGANLAFEKSAFIAVDGYKGFENQPSGDDEFLLHKIANKFPKQIGFIKHKDALVSTNSQNTLTDFINQRLRWASKWSAYKDIKISLLAVFVLLINIFTAFGFFNLIVFQEINGYLLTAIIFRFVVEILFLSNVLNFLGKKSTILFIPLVQFVYCFYVIFIGVFSQFKTFEWKERKYKVD